ncbi:MAG: hypothetical protein GY777_12330 [Candidatus Brocadiaceae bacterium]|nr:hypothetical protein [Candidatus Brocadiaceae bacterium]
MRLIANTTCVIMIISSTFVSTQVFCDQNSKGQKLNELLELSGLVDIIEQARNKNKIQAIQYKQEVMNQLEKNFNFKDPEVWEYFESEYQIFIDSVEPEWTPDEAVQKFTTNLKTFIAEKKKKAKQ